MLDRPLNLATLPTLLSTEQLVLWAPGAAFAVALLLILRRWNHFLITPGMLALTAALFYAYLLIANISIADATARG